MSKSGVSEVLFALQNRRDFLVALGSQTQADEADSRCMVIETAIAVSSGAKLPQDQVESCRRELLPLTDPELLALLLPFSRRTVAYRDMMKLAGQVARVAQGRPPRRFFGLLA